MSPSLQRIKAEVEKPDESKSQEGDGPVGGTKRNQPDPMGLPHPQVPAACLTRHIPNPHPSPRRGKRSAFGRCKGFGVNKRPSTFPTEKEASIPCDMVQAGDINSFLKG